MKPIVRTAALAFALTGSLALAQQQTTPPDAGTQPAAPITRHHAPDPNRQAAHLAKRLNLTPDQTAKVEPILADRDQKIADLRANTSLSHKDVHHQMRAIQKGTEEQLNSVLTPEQMQQMKAMRHRHGRGDGGKEEGQPAPGV